MYCDRCNRQVFYRRPYSGESLCEKCFSNSIEEKVRRTISRYNMLKHGERIGIAVSGGKDSLSLLSIMSKIAPDHGSEIIAITIDEGIEGYRDESIENARYITRKLGIKMIVLGYKDLFGFSQDEAMTRKSTKITSCAICGTLRRRAIDIAISRADVDVVATAHNLDDMVQTFLINVMNGDMRRLAWLSGVSSGSAFKTRRIHPFMEIYEKESTLYAFVNHIPLQTEKCPYMNEGIRSTIRAFLNGLEDLHPGIKLMMLKSALSIAESLRKDYGSVAAKRCSLCGLPSSKDPCLACQLSSMLSLPVFNKRLAVNRLGDG
ncbi:MAG: TIGR00269 family protein [Conexivisphaerales archaeon]